MAPICMMHGWSVSLMISWQHARTQSQAHDARGTRGCIQVTSTVRACCPSIEGTFWLSDLLVESKQRILQGRRLSSN